MWAFVQLLLSRLVNPDSNRENRELYAKSARPSRRQLMRIFGQNRSSPLQHEYKIPAIAMYSKQKYFCSCKAPEKIVSLRHTTALSWNQQGNAQSRDTTYYDEITFFRLRMGYKRRVQKILIP